MRQPTGQLADGFHLLGFLQTLVHQRAFAGVINLHNKLFGFALVVFNQCNRSRTMHNLAFTGGIAQLLVQNRNLAHQQLAHAIQELPAVIFVQ